MSDESYINALPPEIIFHIFSYLPIKILMSCQRVCVKWKEIIEDITHADAYWENLCASHFEKAYKIARIKSRADLNWVNIYQSLSLWPKLNSAFEDRDEFCAAGRTTEEIRNMKLLPNGVLSVHKHNGVVFYNIETLKLANRVPITGNYMRYTENEGYAVLLNAQLILCIAEKLSNGTLKSILTARNRKLFVLVDVGVYHIDLDDKVYLSRFGEEKMTSQLLTQSPEGVMTIGCKNNNFHLLTFERKVYTLVGKKLVQVEKLETKSNIMHVLNGYNLLPLLDWRIYFQWLFLLNQSIPSGPLQDTVLTRIYGDVVFVGSNWGVLRIYYKPYTLGELDIFNSKPLKQYNFMERSDCPVLSTCPILNVDVYEVYKGHMVIVAMPKKIALLNYSHDFTKNLLKCTEQFKLIRITDLCPPVAETVQESSS